MREYEKSIFLAEELGQLLTIQVTQKQHYRHLAGNFFFFICLFFYQSHAIFLTKFSIRLLVYILAITIGRQ